MILSNVSVPLLGMVDTGVVGHLESAAYLGGVAIGSTIFGFLYTGMNFLRMGTTGIAAQRFGAGDNDGLRVSLGQAVIVALLIAAVLIALQNPIGRIALHLIGGETDVQTHALQIFRCHPFPQRYVDIPRRAKGLDELRRVPDAEAAHALVAESESNLPG